MHTLTPSEARAASSRSMIDRPLVMPPQLAVTAPGAPTSVVVRPGGELQPILVADDDADDVFFVQRLLKRTGTPHPVKVFDDGSEVVNYLGGQRLDAPDCKHRCPKLLFLDLNMRGLGGFGFLEWARQQKVLGPLTIVVLSNSAEPEMVSRAMELGAHRYLVKYPSLQTMTTIVHSVYPQTVF